MKKWFLNLCRGLLALLGVAVVISCEDNLGNAIVMYGSPTADYSVKGKVVNMNLEALKGIKVKPLYDNYPPDSTSVTDAQGAFSIERKSLGGVEQDQFGKGQYFVRLIVEDPSGVYNKDTVKVDLVQVKESDGWYRGGFEAKDAKITMLK